MKNSLGDLHNHLMEQIETLNDRSIQGDELKAEIARAVAMAKVGGVMVANAGVALKAEAMRRNSEALEDLPPMLTGGRK